MRLGWLTSVEVYDATVRGALAERKRAHPTEALRILDVGCGAGGLVVRLGQNVEQIVGIVVDASSLKCYRASHVQFAAAPLECLPVADCRFDLVMCAWVSEHVQEPQHAFVEVRVC
jgi:ubiquinone/menaquinone biosynthesis C-methylase UbiE